MSHSHILPVPEYDLYDRHHDVKEKKKQNRKRMSHFIDLILENTSINMLRVQNPAEAFHRHKFYWAQAAGPCCCFVSKPQPRFTQSKYPSEFNSNLFYFLAEEVEHHGAPQSTV